MGCEWWRGETHFCAVYSPSIRQVAFSLWLACLGSAAGFCLKTFMMHGGLLAGAKTLAWRFPFVGACDLIFQREVGRGYLRARAMAGEDVGADDAGQDPPRPHAPPFCPSAPVFAYQLEPTHCAKSVGSLGGYLADTWQMVPLPCATLDSSLL